MVGFYPHDQLWIFLGLERVFLFGVKAERDTLYQDIWLYVACFVEGACAVLYRDAEKQSQPRLSVSQLAARANVRREYVIAEIRRGNIENVEKIGLSYAIPESSAQKWLDNPRRGSRSSAN